MKNVTPLAALVALVVVGVTVELVEQQSKQAAYVLVVVLLLGMITFNAAAFNAQSRALLALFNSSSARSASQKRPTA